MEKTTLMGYLTFW